MGTSDLRLGWGSAYCLGAAHAAIGNFSPLPTPTPPAASRLRGSKAGLMGEGFMAGGDTTGDLSLGHSQDHLLGHLPA